MEFLNYGISGPNLRHESAIRRRTPSSACSGCATTPRPAPAPAAIRARCWRRTSCPNVLFDTREALYRDAALANNDLTLGGVMHYVSINVANLSDWFEGDRRLRRPEPARSRSATTTASRCTSPIAGTTGTPATRRPVSSGSRTSSTRSAPPVRRTPFSTRARTSTAAARSTPTGIFPNFDGVYNTVADRFGRSDDERGEAEHAGEGAVCACTIAPCSSVARLKLTNGGLGNIVMPGSDDCRRERPCTSTAAGTPMPARRTRARSASRTRPRRSSPIRSRCCRTTGTT